MFALVTWGGSIGPEAAAAVVVVVHVTKLVVFGAAAVQTWATVANGLLLVPASAARAYVGQRVADRMPRRVRHAAAGSTLSMGVEWHLGCGAGHRALADPPVRWVRLRALCGCAVPG